MYGYSTYQRVPKERMAPAEGVAHEKYEGGTGARAYLVYTWHDPAKGYYLLAYSGKRMRPDTYVRYRDEAQRDAACAESLKGYRARVEAAERVKSLANPLKVGDLLRCSWGYEQTNVDYYQVTKATKRTVEIREIAARRVETTGWASDRCAPCKDEFVGEPMTKRVHVWQEKDGTVNCSVTMTSYSHAYPCSENETTHRSWYH